MREDIPPRDSEILDLLSDHGNMMEPTELVQILSDQYEMGCVIEALQRALERRKIALDSQGMVVSELAVAA